MDKITINEIVHSLRKISRKQTTARELIDEVSIELDLIANVLAKEDCNAEDYH